MKGRVIKFYNSFFFVKVDEEIIPCKLRGLIKRDKKVGSAIYPGDEVEISKLPDNSGVIEKILPRKSLLSRPAVANVDRVILTFAAASPSLNKLLLNKFITLAEFSNLAEIIICVNKIDLIDDAENFLSEYENLYKIVRVSAVKNFGIEELKKILSEGVTVFAGASGVGKSSLMNKIIPELNLKVGKVSEKILRGKHTTRISELIEFGDGFIVDTPGFSAVDLNFDKKILKDCFKEFKNFAGDCKFLNKCTHTHEPDCKVKIAVEEGKILRERYESYLSIFNELEK